ncbi:MAG: hypothetical protein J6Y02_15170 [Pseudobutyrivibrio sp.]|nr:hypothetical protein [Pseudobutyrivibrio sp.]
MSTTMTNDEILSEFETLFGNEETPDEETAPAEETEDTNEDTSEETAETKSEEEGEASEEEKPAENEEPPAPVEDKRQSKQNYAFAEQRLQIKKNEQFIRSLGKLIGFEDNASVDEIQERVKEALIEKSAKENNISVELAKRLDRAEELLQENNRIKLENKVQEDFSVLIDKHKLDEAAVEAFTNYLIENGKNPIVDSSVDIEAEYLKLHYNDMIKAAVDEALAKETARQKKVEEKAASGAPKGHDKGEQKITTVKELDDLFASIEL